MGKLFLFSGAGISADSGISTFRGASGLWEGENVNKVCNYNNWQDNYEDVHDFYNARRVGLATVEPNDAHLMAKEWQDRYEMVNITQNIDDLFERAGCTDVVHLHGNLQEMRCIACGHQWHIGYTDWDISSMECEADHCHCKKAIKPNVVFFNEVAPHYRTLDKTIASLTEEDVAVVIGTSFQVVNIAAMLQYSKCYRILNNLEPSGSMIDDVEIERHFFEEVFFKKAIDAVSDIDSILREKLG